MLLQFLYVFLVGSFPFNSFLSGFFCSLGFFVLMGKHPRSPHVEKERQNEHMVNMHTTPCPAALGRESCMDHNDKQECMRLHSESQSSMCYDLSCCCASPLLLGHHWGRRDLSSNTYGTCLTGLRDFAVSLRMQVDPQSTEFKTLLLERAYADVLLCGCLMFLIVWNFMG